MSATAIDVMVWFGAMRACIVMLPPEEREALERWDRERNSVMDEVPVGTSDWPGFEPYIGKRPRGEDVVGATRKKRTIAMGRRMQIYERDGFRCCICGEMRQLTVDHILAESRGGGDEEENLRTLCRICNSRKGAR